MIYTISMALSLSYWTCYTKDKVKLQRKSENAVESNRVLKFLFDTESRHVQGIVQASMRDKSYKVEIYLDDAGAISSTTCECVLRHFECHHVAATLLYGYKNVSKTDVPLSWLRKPKSHQKLSVKTAEEMFPLSKPMYRALARPITQEDKDYLYKELSQLGRYTALHWILSPEPREEKAPVALVQDLIHSEEYIKAECKKTWLAKQLVVCPDIIRKVAEQTVGQRENPMWAIIRKMRLTASNFGKLLGAIRTKRFSASLQKILTTSQNIDSISAVQWGIIHESDAVKTYESLGARTKETGIWLHESGVLAASPDALVIQQPQLGNFNFQTLGARQLSPNLLEVKCPFSAREMTVRQAVTSVKSFYLDEDKVTGNLTLNENHSYYHQIQGQIYLTKSNCCDLIVWTPKDYAIVRIGADPNWAENIPKMIDFFYNRFISVI